MFLDRPFFRSLDVLLDGEHHQDFAVLVAAVDVELAVTFEPRIELLHRHVWRKKSHFIQVQYYVH